MKWVRVAAMVLTLGFLLSPVVHSAQTVASAPLMPVLSETEVRYLINKYIDHFKALDHAGVMSLFSKDAVENRMLPYNDIAGSYAQMFSVTSQFIYHLKLDTVETYTKSARASGQYEIIQTLKKSNEMRIYSGKIQWEIVPENGSLKIIRLNYGNARWDD